MCVRQTNPGTPRCGVEGGCGGDGGGQSDGDGEG